MTYTPVKLEAPWQGLVDNVPPTIAPPTSFTDVSNWLVRKGRLISPPTFKPFTPPPDGLPVLGTRVFLDVLGGYHSLVLTSQHAYFIDTTGAYVLLTQFQAAHLTAFPNPSSFPYSMEGMLNQVYFANGGSRLMYVDGSAHWRVAGDVPGTCYFLGKLANHLIMVNCVEPPSNEATTQSFPQRVRWSKSGDPLNWTDFTSGAEDIAEVEDQFTGFATLMNYGYLWRPSGITLMSATGNGLAPFTFDSYSVKGPGCTIPYTLASYGNFAAYVSADDIYLYNPMNGAQPIGSAAKEHIFTDLFNRVALPYATIIPNLTGGKDFLAYMIGIPLGADLTRVYVWCYDDKTWSVLDRNGAGAWSFFGEIARS